MIFNASAEALFGTISVSSIRPDPRYEIWEKTDPFGRTYHGVSHFWHMDEDIQQTTDLSWMEWDGNEVRIPCPNGTAVEETYRETVGIMKSWVAQLANYPDRRFCILASFDDGSLTEGEREAAFTLRFWEERTSEPLIGSIYEEAQPVILEQC